MLSFLLLLHAAKQSSFNCSTQPLPSKDGRTVQANSAQLSWLRKTFRKSALWESRGLNCSSMQMARAAPEDDPLSPFAKGFSDIGESKVLERKPMAMPLQGQNALSRIRNSFRVRQLSFNDWCFETPALSGSPRKSESSASQASAISQIDLHPSGVQNADVSWVPKPSAMQPTLHLLHKPFKAAIDDHDMLIADESDLLSCDESLSCLQSFDYAMPSTKRRRSLSWAGASFPCITTGLLDGTVMCQHNLDWSGARFPRVSAYVKLTFCQLAALVRTNSWLHPSIDNSSLFCYWLEGIWFFLLFA